MDYQTLDPDTQKAPDNKEGLYYGIEVPPGSEDSGKPLCGPNQWPDVVRSRNYAWQLGSLAQPPLWLGGGMSPIDWLITQVTWSPAFSLIRPGHGSGSALPICSSARAACLPRARKCRVR